MAFIEENRAALLTVRDLVRYGVSRLNAERVALGHGSDNAWDEAVYLVLHALHTNEVPFVNGGQHVAVPEISTATSLVVIVVVLAVTTAASLLRTRRGPA